MTSDTGAVVHCPVCKETFDTSNLPAFCPKCAWDLSTDPTLHFSIEPMGGTKLQVYTERVSLAVKNWKDLNRKRDMALQLLDIGHSGIKVIKLTQACAIDHLHDLHPTIYSNPDWDNLPTWAYNEGLLDGDFIGLSCSGFVLPGQKLKIFCGGNLRNIEMGREILKYNPNSKVVLLNDGEAHLMAHYGIYSNPQMCISLGTALGFAVCDTVGNIVRPLDGNNYDISGMKIPTQASSNEVWWALGSNGLEELQNNLGNENGAKHFGSRLGAFMASICSIFRPRTAVFSGGITEKWWHLFQETMLSEFHHNKPDWLDHIDFVKSPYCDNAALIGMTRYIIEERYR